MTAFARAEAAGPWGQLSWELRSVNHRYLEVWLRLPDEMRALETTLRERIAARITRGKIEAGLRLVWNAAPAAEAALNMDGARRVAAWCEQLRPLLPGAPGISPLELLRWPGVLSEPPRDLEGVREQVLGALEAALDEFIATRRREGGKLAALLEQRCASLGALVNEVRVQRPAVMIRLRDKLLARIEELKVSPDPQRLEQELVFHAQRLDVAEELDRLEAHLGEARAILGKPEPAGRRLDFLMQEFNREANTLGSKSADTASTKASMEMKVLIDQMREQIQNIE
jgi:uncharacterized protein (TIGR00255 family)